MRGLGVEGKSYSQNTPKNAKMLSKNGMQMWESQYLVCIGDSSTNLMVVAIKGTNRNPTIWSNYDFV